MVAQTVALPNIKKLFLPDLGFTIADADLAQADAQVVAWEADDEPLKQIFRDPDLDLHNENAKAIFGTLTPRNRQLAKGGVHACLSLDHEVLTPMGWVNIGEAQDQDIMVVNTVTQEAFFEKPKAWHIYLTNTNMYEFQGNGYSQKVTYDHKLPVRTNTRSPWQLTKAEDVKESSRLLYTTYYSGQTQIPNSLVRLVAAYEADGSKDPTRGIRWHLKKKRKLLRLHSLLESLGLKYSYNTYSDGTSNTSISLEDSKLIRKYSFNFPFKLTWSGNNLDQYLDELPYWDGTIGKASVCITNKEKRYCEQIQTLCALRGKSGQVKKVSRAYQVGINNRQEGRLGSGTLHKTKERLLVICPTVSTGAFLIRRKGKISVTGNTNYGAKPRTLAKALGITVHEAERFIKSWFGAHPNIRDWHHNVEMQLAQHRRVTNRFGNMRYYFDRVDSLLPQALAWIPQSTVALVIERGLVNLDTRLPEVDVLMQVHDSVVFQYPTHRQRDLLPKIKECLEITIPYDDPLIIPVGIEVSTVSWGDCKEIDWNGNLIKGD